MVNISETGLAFIVERNSCPHSSEVIKIEFPIPGEGHVAWFAQVVRIEEFIPYKKWNAPSNHKNWVLVAVRFNHLPDGHRKLIRTGLNEKFNEILRARHRESLYQLMQFIAAHFWEAVLYIGLTAAMIATLYYFSQPTENYDSERGTQWGDRYPQFKFFTPKDK